MSGLCSNALGFNEVPERMLKGWGVGCPVLNLQERIQILEMPHNNETQAQITQVLAKQERLQQRMDNFSQIQGWSLPTELGLSRGNGNGGAACVWTRGSLDLNSLLWQRGFPDPVLA